jgi:hypothetical protein
MLMDKIIIPEEYSFMPLLQVDKIIKDIKESNVFCEKINIAGGEPFFYKFGLGIVVSKLLKYKNIFFRDLVIYTNCENDYRKVIDEKDFCKVKFVKQGQSYKNNFRNFFKEFPNKQDNTSPCCFRNRVSLIVDFFGWYPCCISSTVIKLFGLENLRKYCVLDAIECCKKNKTEYCKKWCRLNISEKDIGGPYSEETEDAIQKFNMSIGNCFNYRLNLGVNNE